MSATRFTVFFSSAVAISILASPVQANTLYGLVANGGFETTTNGGGQLGFNTNATGWTNDDYSGTNPGYNFLFISGSADSSGETGVSGNLKLWGPGDLSNNGLPASSPDGGNYIANDGAYEIAAVQQTITGLVIGDPYTLGFWWAGAQQSGYTGPNTEWWDVTFGTQTQDTVILSNSSEGFTGWQYQTFTYTATATSEVLSFLAGGTPNGEPPFSLLDGVSLFQTPEPDTLALIGLGLLAIPIAARFRKKRE